MKKVARPHNDAYLRHTKKCKPCSAVDAQRTPFTSPRPTRCAKGKTLVRAAAKEGKAVTPAVEPIVVNISLDKANGIIEVSSTDAKVMESLEQPFLKLTKDFNKKMGKKKVSAKLLRLTRKADTGEVTSQKVLVGK